MITTGDIVQQSGKSRRVVNLAADELGIDPPRPGWPRVYTPAQAARLLRALRDRKRGRPHGSKDKTPRRRESL